MHPQVIQDHPGECPICHMALTPIGQAGASIGPDVIIDPMVEQNMGVRTAQVTRGPLRKTIRTVGLLKLPEPGMHDVALKVGGWIDKLYADQDGMHVEAGQPLFDLYSPDLQIAAQELISARKAEQSLPSDASAEVKRESRGLVESARRKLLLWGVAGQDVDAIANADQPPKDVPFRSPATGHVEDKQVVQGSAVQPMARVMRIADHSQIWLDAEIYSDRMPLIKPGEQVAATLEALPGKTWRGTIDFVYPHVDHLTRTLTVRTTLDNPDFELRPGMYATAEILSEPVTDAIKVPQEAVIDTGTRKIVFISNGDGHFAARHVRTGVIGDDDQIQIVEGLEPGETVVTSGQFLMDVESRTIEATSTLAAQAPPEPSAVHLSSSASQTRPATEPSELSIAYCPMAKAHWVQRGGVIANPYLGPDMETCGDVQKKVPAPNADSELLPLVKAYLKVAGALDAGRIDSAATITLKAAADRLGGDDFGPIRHTADRLAGATNLKDARAAFQVLSDRLIAHLSHPAK